MFYWYFKTISKYVDIAGRARKAEFRMSVSVNIIIGLILIFFDNFLDITFAGKFVGPIFLFYCLFSLPPAISVTVRWLQDVGKIVDCILLLLLPGIGFIILTIMLLRNSDPNKNKYGLCPKKEVSEIIDTYRSS